MTLNLRFSGAPIYANKKFIGVSNTKYCFTINSINWGESTVSKGNADSLLVGCKFINGWSDSIIPQQTSFNFVLFQTC